MSDRASLLLSFFSLVVLLLISFFLGPAQAQEMATIPAGCFEMGDSIDSCAYGSFECPVHTVCLSAFEMDIHEVTNAEYEACVDTGICLPPMTIYSHTGREYFGNPLYDAYPVIFVSWENAQVYCDWAGKRLPTEAEWEYAARGGLEGKRYPWGDEISCDDANYDRVYGGVGCSGYNGLDDDTHEVGTYAPNGYGLLDVAGNVSEWIYDWYDGSFYESSPVIDPQGPTTGAQRVMRGGAFSSSAVGGISVRVADRYGRAPSINNFEDLGFRCARSGDCIDEDHDGYGETLSEDCLYEGLDCDDDPSDDPPICDTCSCGDVDCAGCADCVNPGATDFCGDGFDSNCDGEPGMPEICDNGIDEDCDGVPDDGCPPPPWGLAAPAEASVVGETTYQGSRIAFGFALGLIPLAQILLLRSYLTRRRKRTRP